MYIYFDSNGYLKEFINDPKREGSQNVNKLYIYIEPSIEDVQDKTIDNQDVKVWMLLNTYPSGTVDFRLTNLLENVTDEERNILNSVSFTLEEDTVFETLPYDAKRDLKYFKYGRYYQFVKLTIPPEVFVDSGEVNCSISLVNPSTSPANQFRFVLDVFSFIVQSSVILKNINITQAQYSYLLSTKIGVANTSLMVMELPETGSANVFYILQGEEENNIYIWNSKVQDYIWVGSNKVSLADYYTRSEGEALEEQIQSVASGSPAGTYATVSDLTTANPNHSKIYLVLADGKWYYYNTGSSAWTAGGTYLSSEDYSDLKENFENIGLKDVTGLTFTNTYYDGDLNVVSNVAVETSSVITLNPGDGIFVKCRMYNAGQQTLMLCEENGTPIRSLGVGDGTYKYYSYIATEKCYVRFSTFVAYGYVCRLYSYSVMKKGLDAYEATKLIFVPELIDEVGETDIYVEQGEIYYLDVKSNTVATNLFIGTYQGGDAYISIPEGASVLRFFCYKDGYLKLQSTDTSIEMYVYKEVQANNIVAKNKQLYIVDINGEGDFTSLTSCLKYLKNNQNEKVIKILSGTYDIFEEYGGTDYIETLGDGSGLNWRDVSVMVPKNTHIIGIGQVNLKWEPSASDIVNQTIAFLFSPLNLSDDNIVIENVSITCSNGRYCIHDECGTRWDFPQYQKCTHKYINVRAEKKTKTYGGTQVYGGGNGAENTYIFENCYFKSATANIWSTHTNSNNSQGTGGCNFTFNNCVFETSDLTAETIVLDTGDYFSNKNNISFNSCYISGDIAFVYNGSLTDRVQTYDLTLLKTTYRNLITRGSFASEPYTPKIFE